MDSMNAGVARATQNDFRQQRRDRVRRKNINRRHLWPIDSQTLQPAFHQAHHVTRLGFQTFVGRVAEGNDSLTRQDTLGQLASTGHDKRRRQACRTGLRELKTIQNRFLRRIDDRSYVRPRDGIRAADKNVPIPQNLSISGIEIEESLKAVRLG